MIYNYNPHVYHPNINLLLDTTVAYTPIIIQIDNSRLNVLHLTFKEVIEHYSL